MFSWPLVGVVGVCWALAMAVEMMPGSVGDVPENNVSVSVICSQRCEVNMPNFADTGRARPVEAAFKPFVDAPSGLRSREPRPDRPYLLLPGAAPALVGDGVLAP